MKAALIVMLFAILLAPSALAQVPSAQQPSQSNEPANGATTDDPKLNAILDGLKQAVLTTNHDLSLLHIERWKADLTQKQQLQHISESVQRNLSTIIPGPATELQAAPGSVTKSFALYHNVNLVCEFLSSLTGATQAAGKLEEFEALAGDVNSIEKVRRELSDYTQHAAAALEASLAAAKLQEAQLQQQIDSVTQATALRQVIMQDPPPAKKSRKAVKKTAPTAQP